MKEIILILIVSILCSLIAVLIHIRQHLKWEKAEMDMMGCCFTPPIYHWIIIFLIYTIFLFGLMYGVINLVRWVL